MLAGPLALRRSLWQRGRRGQVLMLNRLQAMAAADLVIKVPEFDGVFEISPRSHLLGRILVNGEYEPKLASLFLSHVAPDRDVIDVGANVGFYSVAAAKRLSSGRVLAVEPTSGAYRRLVNNLERNEVGDRVITFNGLASDRSGDAEMHVVDGMEEYASMSPLAHDLGETAGSRAEKAAASTVDDLVVRHQLNPAIIKVDVEGAEELVFRGALETLASKRPIILSELADDYLKAFGSSSAQVIALIESQGYQVIDPIEPSIKPGTRKHGDILCLPR